MWLGGDDIDSRVIQFVKEQVAQQEGLADIDGLIAKMPFNALALVRKTIRY